MTTFTNVTPAFGDRFGSSVATLGSDSVVIGAVWDDSGASNAGIAYLFSTNGTFLTTFINPTPNDGDNFGYCIAPFGSDRVLIGAPAFDLVPTKPGTAYLFGTNGTLLTTFYNPTPAAGDHFGGSMAAVGVDHVLIGAPGEDGIVGDLGVAYLFSTNGTLLVTITNPVPTGGGRFGTSAASLGDDRFLIGARRSMTGSSFNGGAAYLFRIDGMLLTTFANPTPVDSEYFGNSVTPVGSDQVLVGAVLESSLAQQAGAAYLFNTNGALICNFTKPSPQTFEFFGWSLAPMGSNRVMIGAYGARVSPSVVGAAYLFDLPQPTLTIAPAAPGNSTISWAPDMPGFVLQETEALARPDWTNSPSGATNPIDVPAASPGKYFRLIKP